MVSRRLRLQFCWTPRCARALSGAGLVAVLALTPGCDTTASTNGLAQATQVSGCGGFHAASSVRAATDSYCDAEVLRWTYDASRLELALRNERAVLQCCGKYSARLVEEEGSYVLRETNAPGQDGCRCECVYDLVVTASPVPRRVIDLAILRQTTDGSDGGVVFRSRLDLTEGQGVEIVDGRPRPHCR